MIKRYFLSNITIMILLNVMVKPFWIFGIDRNVQLTVGHAEYGLYSALFNMTIMFNIILDLGITNYTNRSIASDSSKLQRSIPNALVAKLLLSGVYMVWLILLGFLFKYDERAIKLLLLVGLVQLLNSFLLYLRSNISALHDFKLDSFLSVFDKIMMIAICSVLLFTSSFKQFFVIEWFVYAQLASYGLALMLAFFIIISKYTRIQFQHFSFDEMKRVCKEGIPYAILILLMGIYMRSDSLMLERLGSATDAGLYAQAYRILDTCNIFGFLFAGMLLPMFSRLLGAKNSVVSLVQTSSNFIFPVSIAITAFSLVYAQEIMQILYTETSAEMALVYQLVILCFPAFSVMYVYSTLLTANGNLKILILIAFSGSVLGILLNYMLIPQFAARGVAISSLVVEWTLAILYIIFARKKVNLPFNYQWIVSFVGFFIVLFTSNIVFQSFQLNIIFVLITNAILFLALVYLFQFWKKETLISFIK